MLPYSTSFELPDTEIESQRLPDTCPVSQQEWGSQQSQPVSTPTEPSWGRLCPLNPSFQPIGIEMTKEEYSFGRSPTCDLELGTDSNHKVSCAISKEHFRVKRMPAENSTTEIYAVHLIDLSSNGTFVNGKKVGKENTIVLGNNDEISLAYSKFKVFVYISSDLDEDLKSYSEEVRNKYAISRVLGSGACGVVRLVFEKPAGRALAMKIIEKKKLSSSGKAISNRHVTARTEREVNVLKALSHMFVIRFEDFIDSLDHVFIITEYVEGGELFERARSGMSEAEAKFYFYQLALAIKYLHDEGIIHRDLKPENILLSSKKPESMIKLSDFGFSKFINPESLNTVCGTPLYIAPEILNTGDHSSNYDKRADIWSMGVILYICLSASQPFSNNRGGKSLTEQIQKGLYTFPRERWSKISQKAVNLVKSMMTVDPRKRISIDQILNHPWLQDKVMRYKVNKLLSQSTGDENRNTEESNPRKRKLEEPVDNTFNLKRQR